MFVFLWAPWRVGWPTDRGSIWVGDTQDWMDDVFMAETFKKYGEVTSVRLPRDKSTNARLKFGFVQFATPEQANGFIEGLNGKLFTTEDGHQLRVNRAIMSIGKCTPAFTGGVTVYCGNLDNNVKASDLVEVFSRRFETVASARILNDKAAEETPKETGSTKRFGFVHFLDKDEANSAVYQMDGVVVGTRPMKVRHSSREPANWCLQAEENLSCKITSKDQQGKFHTVAFCGFPAEVTENELLCLFTQFGAVKAVQVAQGSGWVEFHIRSVALAMLEYFANHAHIRTQLVTDAHEKASLTERTGRLAQTKALVDLQMQQAVGDTTGVHAPQFPGQVGPGLEHFACLLQDPVFWQVFENELGNKSASSPDPCLPVLLQDWPQIIGKSSDVNELNEEYLTDHGWHLNSGHGTLPLPQSLRTCA
ncbi:unnamed protein product [Prorocentrum cordatum]|uniref:RRM domain-containing protein n=1 Tax=Prorocentrum cordatum TaxID=2364126 RepID=A0ABN9SW76_9DINO|nr:unnamed protein product [Polarella glacialis]